jgi:hypothetical protein
VALCSTRHSCSSPRALAARLIHAAAPSLSPRPGLLFPRFFSTVAVRTAPAFSGDTVPRASC